MNFSYKFTLQVVINDTTTSNVEFALLNYEVEENMSVPVCVELQDGMQTDRNLSISYFFEDTLSTSQRAGMDVCKVFIILCHNHLFPCTVEEFVVSAGDVVLHPGTTSTCIQLSPVDDNIVENTETFSIKLNSVDSALNVADALAFVIVEDNDSECLMSW